nr:hypothetical protein Itr_chr09CG12540 [Ipomoea trifida]
MAWSGTDGGRAMRSVQGRGFPGCSSQRKGTETAVWSGGVSIPGCSGDCMGGIEKSGSVGVSGWDPIGYVLLGLGAGGGDYMIEIWRKKREGGGWVLIW